MPTCSTATARGLILTEQGELLFNATKAMSREA